MTFKITKYIVFHNDTDFPLLVDSFVDYSDFLITLRVKPREKLILHSSVGEWHMHSMFGNNEDRLIWEDNGLRDEHNIGKFRSDPCASRNYSWLESNAFQCLYSQSDHEKIRGMITLSRRSD